MTSSTVKFFIYVDMFKLYLTTFDGSPFFTGSGVVVFVTSDLEFLGREPVSSSEYKV